MTTTPSKVGQISINVRDLPRAVGFYKTVVGLTYLFEIPDAAFFQCGGLRVMLTASAETSSIVYYQVDDLNAAHAKLVEHGAEVIEKPHLVAPMPDHELWMCFFRDSENNIAAFMEERRN